MKEGKLRFDIRKKFFGGGETLEQAAQQGGLVCPNPGNVHSPIRKSLEQPALVGDVLAHNRVGLGLDYALGPCHPRKIPTP